MKKSILLISSILFVLLSPAQNPDIDILRHINLNRDKSIDGGQKLLSQSAYVVGLAAPIALGISAIHSRKLSLFEKSLTVSASLVNTVATTTVLKYSMNRARPATKFSYIQTEEKDKYQSFPSGHTSIAWSSAVSLSLAYKKWYVVIPSLGWASAVGYSRLHLGAHYPSDVLGGALIGATSAWLTYKASKYLRRRYEKKHEIPYFK